MDRKDRKSGSPYEAIAKTLGQLVPKVPDRGEVHDHAEPQAKTTSIRRATHRGHEVEVVTTYEFKIDGKPVYGHFEVNDAGKLHCHDLPNYSFASAVDLGKRLVDLMPESGEEVADELNPADDDHGRHDHGGGHDHGHGGGH